MYSESQLKRLLGISIVSLVYFSDGCFLLISGVQHGFFAINQNMIEYFLKNGISTCYFVCMPIFFTVGLALWDGKPWGWTASIILTFWSVIALTVIVLAVSAGFVYFPVLIANLAILIYLRKPHVKLFFDQTDSFSTKIKKTFLKVLSKSPS